MGLSSGFTVLIIFSASLLSTSGLYIASSVGRFSLNVASVYVLRVCFIAHQPDRARLSGSLWSTVQWQNTFARLHLNVLACLL
ncbi:unnamed protein product [Tetraodon nigroviridis]|uniref:(spotted green pufferfish) hypothetical protein n=1 Tax=Tetraodon nigroviridis TaxID=99883 RepID=Q4T4D5_TETNG|nr:unnamed protein product [Tetraodon nigroviridis]